MFKLKIIVELLLVSLEISRTTVECRLWCFMKKFFFNAVYLIFPTMLHWYWEIVSFWIQLEQIKEKDFEPFLPHKMSL